MEEKSRQEIEQIIKEERNKAKEIVEQGGKVTNKITEEKEKNTTIVKIEPANGQATSSKIVQNKDSITIENF